MKVPQIRSILKQQYNGAPKWTTRVDKMSDAQVLAIYFRMLRDNQLKLTH